LNINDTQNLQNDKSFILLVYSFSNHSRTGTLCSGECVD